MFLIVISICTEASWRNVDCTNALMLMINLHGFIFVIHWQLVGFWYFKSNHVSTVGDRHCMPMGRKQSMGSSAQLQSYVLGSIKVGNYFSNLATQEYSAPWS